MRSTGGSAWAQPGVRRRRCEPPGDEARVITALTVDPASRPRDGDRRCRRPEVVAASVDDAGGRIGAVLARPGRGPVAPARRARRAAALVGVRRSTASGCATSGRPEAGSTTPPSNSCCRARCRTRPPPRPSVGRAFGRDVPFMALAARPQPGGERRPGGARADAARTLEQAGLSLPLQRHRPVRGDRGRGERARSMTCSWRRRSPCPGSGCASRSGPATPARPSDLTCPGGKRRRRCSFGPVMAMASPVTHFDDLGVLHLLAEIPSTTSPDYPDVVRVAGPGGDRGTGQ